MAEAFTVVIIVIVIALVIIIGRKYFNTVNFSASVYPS
jgi:type IV secretory pathway TrbL component